MKKEVKDVKGKLPINFEEHPLNWNVGFSLTVPVRFYKIVNLIKKLTKDKMVRLTGINIERGDFDTITGFLINFCCPEIYLSEMEKRIAGFGVKMNVLTHNSKSKKVIPPFFYEHLLIILPYIQSSLVFLKTTEKYINFGISGNDVSLEKLDKVFQKTGGRLIY